MADPPHQTGPAADEASRWIARANDDLTVMRLIIRSGAGISWAACFHAQQAAEKAIKSLLVLHGIDFPKSHVLTTLAALLPADVQQLLDFGSIAELTPWAVAGRYPEDTANPDHSTTEHLAKIATTVTSTAESTIATSRIPD